VTLPGDFLRSRISQAIYRQIGVEELIAMSPSEYIKRSVAIATNSDYRRALHKTLVDRSKSLFHQPKAMQDWNQTLAALANRS
jgi:predicted O-linked N-acetylglucosamine transferase (SPINDLY family)